VICFATTASFVVVVAAVVRRRHWGYLGAGLAPTRIQLCGRFALTIDGRRVEDRLPGRQGRLLLAFLAANRLRTVTRNEAVAALWPTTMSLHRAESALAQGDPHGAWAPAQVAMFVTGRIFLPGEGLPWIDTERRHLAGLHVRALETYAGATLGIGGTELAAAMRAVALDREGNCAEALLVYEALRTKLRDDLGLSPSPPTLELYRRLLR
jgi:hypothetical protein